MTEDAPAAVSESRARLGGLPMLDGLRAVAAGMVLLTHAAFSSGEVARGAAGAALSRFDAGVAIFFVLSGFLLYRPFVEAQLAGSRSPSTRHYLTRRAVRILPAYWIALAAVLIATTGVSIGTGAANAALLQVYVAGLLPDFTQTWSLSTEVAFYVALPLLALALGRRVRARSSGHFLRAQLGLLGLGVALCWVFVAIVSSHGHDSVRRMNTWLPGHLDWFAIGMALAAIWVVGRHDPGSRVHAALRTLAAYPGTCLLGAAVLFWFAATPLAGPRTLTPSTASQAVTKEILYAGVAGLLLVAAAFGDQHEGRLAAVLASRPARYLGRISYAVFLWHLLVMHGVYALTGWRTFTGHFVGVAVLTGALTVLVAAASWRLVERPLLERSQRRPRASAVDVDASARPMAETSSAQAQSS